MDGKPGQKGSYNIQQNTFELEREGRISIWLEFKFAAELLAFLIQYRAYFDQVVSITGDETVAADVGTRTGNWL